jgi:hypothetical protein
MVEASNKPFKTMLEANTKPMKLPEGLNEHKDGGRSGRTTPSTVASSEGGDDATATTSTVLGEVEASPTRGGPAFASLEDVIKSVKPNDVESHTGFADFLGAACPSCD